MARLPDYTALGATPVPQPAGGIAGYEPTDTSNVGRSVSAAGQALEEAAGILAETNQRQDMMAAEAALNRLHAQRLDLEAGNNGFQKVKGSGAVGQPFLDSYEQRFTDVTSEIEKSLGNDHQRKLFQQRVPVAGLQYRSSLLTHQARETDKFNTETETDTIELARRQIFTTTGNPEAINAGLTQIDWAIDQRAKRMGWDPTTVIAAKAKYREKVFEDAASIMVERDPVGTLAAMNKRLGIGTDPGRSGVVPIDEVDPKKLIELQHRARSYVAQANNKLLADDAKRMKEAEDATKQLQSFTLTGQMTSPQYEAEVLAKTAGTPFEAAARQMIAASYAGALHGSKTLAQQEEALRQIDARVAAAGSSPEDAKLVQSARAITESQKAAYKENPWAAATRFGRQPGVAEVPISSPDQVPKIVAARLPMMTGVEVYAGQPVSPLQPNEAKAWAQQLQALPPDQRAEALGQTGVMLSVARAAALADQLDKHDKPLALALKMGLDRTSTGRAASALVLRGAQALADKTVKKDDTALAGWRAEIATLVRGSLGDERAEQDIIDAAYYIRAAQEQEGISPAGYSLKRGADHAIAMVIGLPIERGGVKTLLPRGMKEGEFDTKLSGYTADKLRAMTIGRAEGTDVQRASSGVFYVRGTPITPEALANRLTDYGMRRDGQGRYVPIVRNAPITLDPAGQQLLRLEVR